MSRLIFEARRRLPAPAVRRGGITVQAPPELARVVPPSLLIWIFSPLPSAVLVPETVRLVSLVMKSPAVPLSLLIEAMFSVAVGAAVSISINWMSTAPAMAARSAAIGVMPFWVMPAVSR